MPRRTRPADPPVASTSEPDSHPAKRARHRESTPASSPSPSLTPSSPPSSSSSSSSSSSEAEITLVSKRPPFRRIVRFIPKDYNPDDEFEAYLGEPVDPDIDVGQAVADGQEVLVNILEAWDLMDEIGPFTGEQRAIHRLLPLFMEHPEYTPEEPMQVPGAIRCIGLNYVSHAKEVGLEIPTVPTMFLKPETALVYHDEDIVIPKSFVDDDAADYEAEVAIILAKDCKNVTEDEAMDYVLGITAANDVSSRKAQFAQSQWCYSKGFDSSCPIGPTLVHRDAIKDWSKVSIQGKLNGKVVQESDLSDLIFSIPKIVSFLSQGTTLKAATVILTGTPAGIGWTSKPRRTLQHGDVFTVTISHGAGSLINKVRFEGRSRSSTPSSEE
ncbi:related to 2-keto-4-pentenoate hydratase/2-oxohepta-3-ene-1,7-dioic acid hydratase (catechol pathway) [Ustilago trichophora]|uniref:Related to 2-keto-4-pentenoate hydratase/2-oxohepta-3-ene-1,7-dioic acid hydratase (Catechol pathway) n=1 Tax=Ustilago trichophora TaxID=86804 RepID=A0A5C3ENL5_9BASI|nr:related to 2-keto-4-pentenoate hydratase/2-oxohepta-3-ene-1,7-dioic acid hydratase (catechol pathway) [Ustilago trichophora]